MVKVKAMSSTLTVQPMTHDITPVHNVTEGSTAMITAATGLPTSSRGCCATINNAVFELKISKVFLLGIHAHVYFIGRANDWSWAARLSLSSSIIKQDCITSHSDADNGVTRLWSQVCPFHQLTVLGKIVPNVQMLELPSDYPVGGWYDISYLP